MNNKEKFLALVSEKDIDMLKKIEKSINNPSLLRESINIARKVSNKLKELSLSKEELANKMNVSLNEVNEILKGTEDLSLSLIVKIQEALNLQLLTTGYSESTELSTELDTTSVESNIVQDNHYLNFILQFSFSNESIAPINSEVFDVSNRSTLYNSVQSITAKNLNPNNSKSEIKTVSRGSLTQPINKIPYSFSA